MVCTQPMSEKPAPFTHQWRLEHARVGDSLLDQIRADLERLSAEQITAMAALAQAHYAAANVRAKPGTVDSL